MLFTNVVCCFDGCNVKFFHEREAQNLKWIDSQSTCTIVEHRMLCKYEMDADVLPESSLWWEWEGNRLPK